jgi:WD40 repeat protein
MDDPLADDDYLLYADWDRPRSTAFALPRSHDRAWLVRETPQARNAAPDERIAMFSVTEALEKLGTSFRERTGQMPYLARWAEIHPAPRASGIDGIGAVCPVTVDGRDLLASGGQNGAVGISDPATGSPIPAPDESHQQPVQSKSVHSKLVHSICPVTVNGRNRLASASEDCTVQIWDPMTKQPVRTIQRQKWIHEVSVCPVAVYGRDLVASGGTDGAVRIWDPAATRNEPIATGDGHHGWVYAVCPVTVNGRDLLASTGNDGMVRIWEPATMHELDAFELYHASLHGLCAVTVNGRDLLASGTPPGAVRLWDPASRQWTVLEGHGAGVSSVCPVTMNGTKLLASGSHDRTVRIWDPASGICQLTIPVHYQVTAVCEVAGLLVIGLDTGLLVITLNPGS